MDSCNGSRHILLTGASGFLGKVVLEELFRQRDAYPFTKVSILVRSSRSGEDAQTRFDETIAASPCFSMLDASWTADVEVVSSDLTLYHCGIDAATYTGLCGSITQVIHCAGDVRFDSPTASAVRSNISSTLNLLALAQDCVHVPRFVYTSTAYVTPYQPGPITATLASLPWPATDIYEDLEKGHITKQDAIAESGHANIYTLTKCLTEHLLLERRGNIPVTIVRPSIISASWQFPFPGWIDSKAAFAGFVVGFATGMLRVTRLDIVPVDEVASRLVIEAITTPKVGKTDKKSSTSMPGSVAKVSPPTRIVFSTATLYHSIPVGATVTRILDYVTLRPSTSTFAKRTPKIAYLGPRDINFKVQEMIHHRAPLRLAATWMRLLGNEAAARKAGKTGRLLKEVNVVFPHYTCHTYDFRSDELLPADFDADEYLSVSLRGIEKHLLENVAAV
jgi:alcohol-forming fatty acyl-CoA reductase